MSMKRRNAQLCTSQILHVCPYCEFLNYNLKWQKQNGWEVLLDNKLFPQDLIAAHLEPLTRSSSSLLSTSQEDKNHTQKNPI